MSVSRAVASSLSRSRALFHPSNAPDRLLDRGRAVLQRDIERLANVQGTALTLRELYDVGQRARECPSVTRVHSAQWLHNELPIRLAHRVRELSQLPYGLAEMPSVVDVREMYEQSFTQLREAPCPRDVVEETAFSELLGTVRKRHDAVVRLIAKGVLELKTHCGKSATDLEIRSFLDRFYMSRIGIWVLISHHLALGVVDATAGAQGNDMAGVINTECRPVDLIHEL